jgi:hypothetical protein
VKVFIRNTQNGWYYREPSEWTPDQGAALDLGQVARAVERIFEAHLENVEILLCYDEPKYDLILQVPPSPSRQDPLKRGHANAKRNNGKEARPEMPRKKWPPL